MDPVGFLKQKLNDGIATVDPVQLHTALQGAFSGNLSVAQPQAQPTLSVKPLQQAAPQSLPVQTAQPKVNIGGFNPSQQPVTNAQPPVQNPFKIQLVQFAKDVTKVPIIGPQIQNVTTSPAASLVKAGVGELTGNQKAFQSNLAQTRQRLNQINQSFAPTFKNGKLQMNPTIAQAAMGTEGGIEATGAKTIEGYHTSGEMVKDYADMIKGQESGLKGGQLVPTADGGYKRTTEHSPFYSNFYGENGKAPTNGDWLAEAERQLSSGQGIYGASDVYKALKTQEEPQAIAKAIESHYAGSAKPTGDEVFAKNYVTSNSTKAMADYNARVQDKFGTQTPNVVSGDEAKYVIPGFDATKSVSYHEPASALAKVKYDELLADPTTRDKPVMLMAGGSGAGKTSALKTALDKTGVGLDDYAAIIDTNSNKLESAGQKIDQALKTGRQVEMFYVDRDIVKAFTEGVIPRARSEGRIVPIDAHLDTHIGSREVFQKLQDKYRGNPNVVFSYIDNRGAHGTAAMKPVDEMPQLLYNRSQIAKQLGKVVSDAENSGQISPEEATTFRGSETPGPRPEGRTSPGRQSEQELSPVEQKIGRIESKPYTGPNLNAGAFSPADQKYLESLSPAERAELTPAEQMAFAEPKTPLASPAENTAKNPIKVTIPEAKAGDYQQARINPQLASNPVEFAGGQWVKAMRNLTSDERANFWRAVEKPELSPEYLAQHGLDGDFSPALQEAIDRWRDVDNRIHATSQELGGNTNFLNNHGLHPWNLPEGYGEHVVNGGAPDKFSGLNSVSRKYRTIEQGEKESKLTLGNDPIKEGLDYIGASSTLLKRRALAKSLVEADREEDVKGRSLDIGGGNSVRLSERGYTEAKGYERLSPGTRIGNIYRKAILRPTKQTLLSVSQFHPINISLLKAGPGVAIKGHPILAARGVYGTFRAQFGRAYSDALQQKALKDGTVEFGARVGAPMKFGSDFGNEGTLRLGHAGLGERTIFEKAIPAMHYRALQALRDDLDNKGLSYDSPEAKAGGSAINKMLGFVNTEAQNLSKATQRQMSNILLAPQFTRSKWELIRTALTERGLGGNYGRAAIIGNTAMDVALMLGVGYLLKQKSDDIKDMLIRAIFAPAIASNQKDAKGNTIEYRLPASYTSEVLGLAFTVNRGTDGHLHVSFEPTQIPGNIENYAKARLNVPAAAAVKLKTNTNYAGKPLYDPNAPLGTKVQQATTTLGGDVLPIGLQGLTQTPAIKNRLPQGSQQIINANSSGNNPLIKSLVSSLGATPVTDKTVGKGLQTTQFYSAQDQVLSRLNANDKAAWNSIHPQSKNPVTGTYQVTPSVFDTPKKAEVYLANPNVLAADDKLNQILAGEGQKVDPFFKLPPAQQRSYLQYQTMAPGGPDETNWKNDNPWYKQFDIARAAYFQTLPPSDPNKPKLSLQPPSSSPQVQALLNQYSQLTDPAQKANFINNNPSLSDFFGQTTKYTNDLRTSRGLTPLKTYPTTDPATEALTTQYMAADKATRSTLISNNPVAYANMQNYLAEVSLFDLEKNAAVDQLQGNQPNQSELKSAYSLGHYDIAKNSDGTFSINPQEAYAQGQSSGNKPLVPLPKIKRPKKLKMRRPPHEQKFRVPHIKKAGRIRVQSRGQLRPVQVAKPVKVVNLKS